MPKNNPGAYSDPSSPHFVKSASRRRELTQRAMKGPFSKGSRYGGSSRPPKRAGISNRKAVFTPLKAAKRSPGPPATEGRQYLSDFEGGVNDLRSRAAPAKKRGVKPSAAMRSALASAESRFG